MKSYKSNHNLPISTEGRWIIERQVPAKCVRHCAISPFVEGEHIHTLRGRAPAHTSKRSSVFQGYTEVQEWKWEELKACDDPLKADEFARLYKRTDKRQYRIWDRENDVEWRRYD